jgi:hypothetical protein
MKAVTKGFIIAGLLGGGIQAQADSDLLAHVACQAEISALGEARGLELSTGKTYVGAGEGEAYRYYVNATDSAAGDAPYRATCLVTPRGEVLEAAIDDGRWAYTPRRLGDGNENREGLAVDSRR